MTLKIGLIGAGTMGSNWARVIAESDHELHLVGDADASMAQRIADVHETVVAKDVSEMSACDAVVVAASTDAHATIARQVIGMDKPLLVEKPLATQIDEAREMVAEAADRNVPIMCGFVERFNPVFTTVQKMIADPPMHVVALRHSPTDGRRLANAAYDLLIHDIDLLLQLVPNITVSQVSGAGVHVNGKLEAADCTLKFDSGLVGTFSASRISQRKQRQITIATAKTLFDLDLLRADLTVYRHVSHRVGVGGYRSQTEIDIPMVRHSGEPIALELEHFVALAKGEVDPAIERDSILPAHEIIHSFLESIDVGLPVGQ